MTSLRSAMYAFILNLILKEDAVFVYVTTKDKEKKREWPAQSIDRADGKVGMSIDCGRDLVVVQSLSLLLSLFFSPLPCTSPSSFTALIVSFVTGKKA